MDTIIFLHGWGAKSETFSPILGYFKRNFRVLCIDFDCNPNRVMTLDDYVTQVEEQLATEGVSRCNIIAHSFGARVAVLLSLRNPDLVKKMVLTGAAGLKPRFSVFRWLKIKYSKFRVKLGLKPCRGSADYRKLSPTGKATFKNIILRDLSAEITLLDVETLLIHGRNDRAVPLYLAKRWTKFQRCGTLEIYKHAGHFPFIDEPARFISDAQRFLCN